jgi:hypothetical protein
VAVIDEQLALLDEEVRRVVPDAELEYSLASDRQGIGVRAGSPPERDGVLQVPVDR